MKEVFENGSHQITNENYHLSLGLSRSALWTFKKSPALYWHEYLNPDYVKPETTPAMLLGELVHNLVLEPEKFDDEFKVSPNLDRRTKQGKADWDTFLKETEGRNIITHDQFELAQMMQQRLIQNNTFMALLDNAKVEQSIYFTHDRTGLQCKVRPDIWNNNIVTDLKTTEDASPRAFQSSAYKYGYFLQAAMIHEALRSLGIKMDKFVFACVEKKEPYLEALYVLDQAALDYGLNLFNKLMDDYAACLIKDEWQGYGIQSLTLPNYANYED